MPISTRVPQVVDPHPWQAKSYVNPRTSRPVGWPHGSCRTAGGSSSPRVASRPRSSSPRSEDDHSGRRTPERRRQPPQVLHRPRRRSGRPPRRIRRVGSYCGNLGPPSVSAAPSALNSRVALAAATSGHTDHGGSYPCALRAAEPFALLAISRLQSGKIGDP